MAPTPINPQHQLKSLSATIVVLVALCAAGKADAANFTYSGSTSTTTQWNAGTSWSATPVSAADTALIFSATQAAGVNTISNNDISGKFLVNSLNLTYVGPASETAPTVTVSGNALAFTSNGATTPTLTINSTGTVRPTLSISNNLILSNNLTISNPSASNTASLSGVISGSGALTKSGSGSVTISNIANSFTGPVNISNGGLTVSSIGNSGSNSALGTNGTIAIGGSGNSGSLTWTGTTETTDEVFAMGGSTGNATLSASTAG